MRNIWVSVTSASRPKLLPYVLNSFDSFIHYSGDIKKIWHEDFVFPLESEKVIHELRKRKWTDILLQNNPPKGIGHAIQVNLSYINSKYMFNLQDDWEFELPIDLDHITHVMDQNPHINCIFFNKRQNLETIDGVKFQEEEFNFLRLTKYNHFPFLPGIWRTDFIKRNWKITKEGKTQEGWFNNHLNEPANAYIYGPIGFPRTVRHLGYSWSVKPLGTHPVKKDGYGGNHEIDKIDHIYRAKWLPKQPDRPKFNNEKVK